ncbi:hypothetical protein P872_18120 [Rhodonellum psychrophilum GCM71 = DSM 17998]|uniref:Uncharacterized protein n=1 Tax=Rhodonellum psychrophilum GCM71 = DSM 17998 TaxID=1123057 RepID=U5BXZ0_9BACT|nr:hypothetical protein P872_18120 [Rhodonellum psychrophilum GCM71 = DSM 17998]
MIHVKRIFENHFAKEERFLGQALGLGNKK